MTQATLVIHGGAGALSRNDMTSQEEAEFRRVLYLSLQTGLTLLSNGASASEAVESSIAILEDESCFNAGKGSVLNHTGIAEMEASFMEGTTQQAGAACGLHHIQNPIKLARQVMLNPQYVFLNGVGAESFAQQKGLTFQESSYFKTPLRADQLEIAKKQDWVVLDHGIPTSQKTKEDRQKQQNQYGTVGAVALDQKGHLAAGTSTGGMTNKKWGRIGDAPIIGSGTFADDHVVAVSTTGHGEYFLRTVAAHSVYGRMKWGKQTLKTATEGVIFEQIQNIGGTGGLIALTALGEVAMPFNSFGMFRGWGRVNEKMFTQIWHEDPQSQSILSN